MGAYIDNFTKYVTQIILYGVAKKTMQMPNHIVRKILIILIIVSVAFTVIRALGSDRTLVEPEMLTGGAEMQRVPDYTQKVWQTYDHAIVMFDQRAIPVVIADTYPKRQQGLSDTRYLPAGEGMLFVFDTMGHRGFWMKNMHYALDMVWLDSDLTVVHIDAQVTPDTYPELFGEEVESQYVLEIAAGMSEEFGIQVGDQAILEKTSL